MTRAIVVGAGVAGLACALFAARRGHPVVLVERDPAGPAGPADQLFDNWRRPGLPQARHSHKFLGRSCQVLAGEAPDLLDRLRAAGALAVPISRFGMLPERPDEFAIAARRVVYEAVLRRAVAREPGVRLLSGRAARALASRSRGGVPRVTGVVLDGGQVLAADLVVDATGRRGRLLRSLPVRPPPPHTQRCGFVYLTRHYRLRPGRELPTLDRPLAVNLGYGAALAFPADNGTFSLSLTLSVRDPWRRSLLRPATWDRFVAAEPHTARWAERGEPWGRVEVIAGIEDRWQRLVTGAGDPVVAGLVLIGDAALQNNPTYGRGVSLAFAQAQQVARRLGSATDDPARWVVECDRWTGQHLGIWHRAQTTADAAALAVMEAGLRGEPAPVATDPFARLLAAIEALAATDPLVARALARMAHLLITPAQLLADREVVGRATRYLRHHQPEPARSGGLSRAQFEAIAAA
jgi:flavin-dependent dehydrogenase